ncbi:MAG TPA: carbohydrate kinase family protein [Candidatus Limnocylindrales bacterium]
MIRGGAPEPRQLLLGALSLDIYLGRDLVLPGGGALNMAWRWRGSGVPFRLLSRVGDDRPEVFRAFLDRHDIPSEPGLVAPGRSASIDIVIQPDLQPWMDNFVEGVWATFRLLPDEELLVAASGGLHVVLVEGAIRELRRLGEGGLISGTEVTADFLAFRHYSVARMADTMADVDIGFVGWPGELDDPTVAGIRGVAHDQGKLVVVTFGSRGVGVFDGRRDGGGDLSVPVDAIPVRGTTLGCGDAFIAGFLESWRLARDVRAAVEAGKRLGAEATAWRRPLPDDAYGKTAAIALAAADAAASAG